MTIAAIFSGSPVDHPGSVALTSGESLEWTPVAAAADRVAFVAAGPQQPPTVAISSLDGSHRASRCPRRRTRNSRSRNSLRPNKSHSKRPTERWCTDNCSIAGAAKSGERKPGVIFVHGGPPRQMLLGWHYMDYYSNGYAVNQYLAAHGFVVLSVNYRLGIGYGRRFIIPSMPVTRAPPNIRMSWREPASCNRSRASMASASAIWGGSYGGYLTALALARNSDIFKAGVDLHGVHDWSRLMDGLRRSRRPASRRAIASKALEVAWNSSPDAASRWLEVARPVDTGG